MPSARQTSRGAHQEGLKQDQTEPHPAGGERFQIERGAVEQVQEAAIALVAEAEEANQAGDAGPLGAAREADQGQGHPEEGAQPSAGGAESAEGVEPGGPEGHDIDASTNADSITALSVTSPRLFPPAVSLE